jgi:SAM-dependent methyltransferase
MKRNLLFYLYPRKWSVWPWHIEQLLKYKHVWNGRKILIIAEDSNTTADKKLLPIVQQLGAEIHKVPNDPVLGETRWFVEKLGLLESKDPDEATFYAHSKGVTQQGAWLGGAVSWSKGMYDLNLGSVPAVEQSLSLCSAVGCFRHFLNHAGARWCYAGTFFWLKHSTIFNRHWRSTEHSRFGVEGYPGRHLRWGEMRSFTPDNVGPVWLYNGGVTEAYIQQCRSYWGMPMHGSVMNYLRSQVAKAEIQDKTVLEIGSYNVNGTPRDVFIPFAPKQYVGIDQGPGPGVDRVINASDMLRDLGPNSFDVVLSTEMLEHARDWRTTVSNMKAVTKPGGLLYVTTRGPGFPFHGFPEDHWRFTVLDFRRIFADMGILNLIPDPDFPGVFIKCRKPVDFKPINLDKIHVVPAPACPPPAPTAIPAHVAVVPQPAPGQPYSPPRSPGIMVSPSAHPSGPGRMGPSVTPIKH